MPMAIHEPARADFQQLHHHCGQCVAARGPLHRWRCVAESVNAFVATRIITVLVAVGVLVLIGLSLPLHV